jgi:glycosyltransferase involved in cell wall biosynthesis
MKKVLFVNNHPAAATYDGHVACTIANAMVKSGEYEVLMFGVTEEYVRPYGITVKDYENRWIVQSIVGDTPEVYIRRALKSEDLSAVFLVGDPDDFIWVYSADNEIRRNIPIILYTTLKEYHSIDFMGPYFDSVDGVIAGDRNTVDRVPGSTLINKFVDIEKYEDLDAQAMTRESIFGEYKKVFLWDDINSEDNSVISLLELWKEVVGRDDSYILFISTDDPVDGSVNIYKAMSELGLTSDNVKVFHDFTEEQIKALTPSYIRHMVDCTINFSSVASFPRPVYESLACGTPVISVKSDIYDFSDFRGVEYFNCERTLVSGEIGYVYSNRPVRQDFINKVLSFRGYESQEDKETDINLVEENFKFKADFWVDEIGKIIEENADRTSYIENDMIFVSEVKCD